MVSYALLNNYKEKITMTIHRKIADVLIYGNFIFETNYICNEIIAEF